MAKAKTVKASKINAETARNLELLDAAAMSCGRAMGAATNGTDELARALRLNGYQYANEGGDAVQGLKARTLMHYGEGWLIGRGLADNVDARNGVTMTPDAFKALEGSATDITSPKGRAKPYREACTSAGLMVWRRAADAADPDGAVVRKAEQAAKKTEAGKAKERTPKPGANPKAKTIKCDAAVLQAFEQIAADKALTKLFMAWAAQNLPDVET